MARLYRLGLNGEIPSDETTRFIDALKEIRACLEAETMIDVQQRLAALVGRCRWQKSQADWQRRFSRWSDPICGFCGTQRRSEKGLCQA